MSRDAWREYHIARAVWLYQRLCRVIAAGDGAKQRALADRIVRWQRGARRDDVAEYYARTRRLDDEAQGNARIEESRARGRQVIATIPAGELAQRFERYGDGDDE